MKKIYGKIQANVGTNSLGFFIRGYRVIGIGYDKGDGANRFLYNINTCGHTVRIGFQL